MGTKKTLRGRASDLADAVGPHVENARDKAAPHVADARDRIKPVVNDARDRVTPLLADARDKATPYLSDARDKAAPYLSDARDKVSDTFTSEVVPAVTAALTAADEATEEARAETMRRGKAVAAALKGEVEAPKQTHRIRNLLVLLGLGGAAYGIYTYFFASEPSSAWQASTTSTPVEAVPADDVAASDPAEAASDATDVPHDASTPDSPVTEVDLDRK